MIETKSRYDLFVSYSHKDKAIVHKLATRLRKYRPWSPWWRFPKARRLQVFVDDDEGRGSVLEASLEQVLVQSTTLLVACSPSARQSTYVAQEIRAFGRLKDRAPMLAVIVDGMPNDEAIRANAADEAAFPQALLETLQGVPWAPRFNGPDAFSRRNRTQWYHLLASIYNEERAIIERRERRRLRRRLMATLAAISAVGGLVVASLIREEVRFRNNVGRAVEHAVNVANNDPDLAILLGAFALRNSTDEPVRNRARRLVVGIVSGSAWDKAFALERFPINSAVWTRDGTILAAGNSGWYLIDASSGQVTNVPKTSHQTSARAHPSEPRVAVLSSDGYLSVIDTRTAQERKVGSGGGEEIAWCRDKNSMALYTDARTNESLLSWDWRGPRTVPSVIGDLSPVWAAHMDVTPDCGAVAVAALSIVMVQRIDGRLLATEDIGRPQCYVRWSPDGRSFATADDVPNMSLVHIWTMNNNGELQNRTIGAHHIAVSGLAWSPNGMLVASVDRGGQLRIHPLNGETGRQAVTLTTEALSVDWSYDGRQLLVTSFDGTLKTIFVDPNIAARSFRIHGRTTGINVRDSNFSFGLTDDDGEQITDRELADFARKHVARSLRDNECQAYLGARCPAADRY